MKAPDDEGRGKEERRSGKEEGKEAGDRRKGGVSPLNENPGYCQAALRYPWFTPII